MIAIVGAGFSGIGMGVKLKEAGLDFVILERAADLGGTWRDNDYPGCACDVPSHVYSYSFELNPDWSQEYAPQAEIQAYLRHVADKYGVTEHIRFNQEVGAAAWSEAEQEWRIETGAGEWRARYLVAAAGPLSEPVIPALPGLESFEGASFHSAEWDHEHRLEGERVAVVGTGASAIQFVPQIQPQVAELKLFQRTPPWIVPRMNRRIGPRRRRLMRRFPPVMKLTRAALYAFQEARVLGFRKPRIMWLPKRVALHHLRRQVPDSKLRARLTPDYVIGCKRILVSDDYLPSLSEPNVEVIDGGLREVRPRSVVDSVGAEHTVDTIIFGTGFEVTEPPIAGAVRGRDGRTLAEHWAGGMQAHRGTTVAGFPNLFFLLGPNTGLGHNSIVYMIESQLRYVMGCLAEIDRRGAGAFEVREDVQREFNEGLQGQMEGTVWTAGQCQSWYLDAQGRNTTIWPSWTFRFRRLLRRFDPEAYEFRPPRPAGDAPVPAGGEAATPGSGPRPANPADGADPVPAGPVG